MHESENLPPAFAEAASRRQVASLWQREVGRDFINNVVILRLLISFLSGYYFTPETRCPVFPPRSIFSVSGLPLLWVDVSDCSPL